MGDLKHTPAPWELRRYPIIELNHIWIIGEPENPKDQGIIAKAGGNRSAETIEANAHLIAAAPELLQALEHVTHHLENALSDNREFDATGARLDIKAAKEAIKKAKGKKNDS